MAEEGCHANTATGDGFELRMESGNGPLRAVRSEPSHRPPWLTGGRAGGGTRGSPVFSVPSGETRSTSGGSGQRPGGHGRQCDQHVTRRKPGP